MKTLRRLSIAALFALGLSPAFAQAPPAVPALPDTPRLTSYTIAGTTCACAVNFALYGNANLADYYDWVEVFLNGVQVAYNDPTYGWAITSPTGALASIARPITDAVLTFTNVQTGTVRIVGAARPARLSQWSENQGVSARNLNVAFTGIVAQLREIWDKINDVSGRNLKSQPGNTIGLLPLPAACASGWLGFDVTGLNPVCRAGGTGSGNVTGPASSTVGHLATWSNVTGSAVLDSPLGAGTLTALAAAPDATGGLASHTALLAGLPSLTTSQLYKGTGSSGVAQAATPGTDYAAPGTAMTISALWKFTASDACILGSSTGCTAFATANSSGTNYTWTFPADSDTAAGLTAADQTLSGGANLTVHQYSTGNITVDCGLGPGQWVVNGGAFSITAPAADGECVLQIENNGSASTVTWSGFSEGSNTGDALDTTASHYFQASIIRIHGRSHYLITALQ